MKRVLSSIGIGAATVDTVLPRTELRPGETVEVDVEMYGGETTQEINGIYFALKTRVESDGDVEERVLASPEVNQSISLAPGDTRTIPVDIELPLWTPLTVGGASVWLATGLDIDWARDPTDEDRIDVVPDEFVAALLEAVEDLGFALRFTELVDTPYLDDRPFAQEFDFRPTEDRFVADLDELEITVMPREDDLRVFVEFDRRDPIAEEYDVDFDEQEIPITFDQPKSDAIRRRIESGIDQHT